MQQHWERLSRKEFVSLLRDLSYETKPVLAIDAYWKLEAH